MPISSYGTPSHRLIPPRHARKNPWNATVTAVNTTRMGRNFATNARDCSGLASTQPTEAAPRTLGIRNARK